MVEPTFRGMPVEDFTGAFSRITESMGKSSVKGCDEFILDLSEVDLTNARNLTDMCSCNPYITRIKFGKFPENPIEECSRFAEECSELKSIDLHQLFVRRGSKYTSIVAMFYGCKSLTDIDIRGIDISTVNGLSSAFRECHKLKRVVLTEKGKTRVIDRENDGDIMQLLTSPLEELEKFRYMNEYKVWHLEKWPVTRTNVSLYSSFKPEGNVGRLPRIIRCKKAALEGMYKTSNGEIQKYHILDFRRKENRVSDAELVLLCKKVSFVGEKEGIIAFQ